MASFDIIDSVGNAYHFLWLERRYLARLALAPVVIKMTCLFVIDAYGYDTNFIRQALVMLPSYFMDGWMLSHVVRFCLFGQRWPFRSTGSSSDVMVLEDRARGIVTGTVMYVLIRYLLTGLAALAYMSAVRAQQPGAAASGMKPESFLGAVMVVITMLWAFRLFWLYIPAAANVSMSAFLKRIHGFSISFYMVGAWLVGYLPLMSLFIVVESLLVQPFGGLQASLPVTIDALLNLFRVFIDTAIEIVTTFALTWGIKSFLVDRPPGR